MKRSVHLTLDFHSVVNCLNFSNFKDGRGLGYRLQCCYLSQQVRSSDSFSLSRAVGVKFWNTLDWIYAVCGVCVCAIFTGRVTSRTQIPWKRRCQEADDFLLWIVSSSACPFSAGAGDGFKKELTLNIRLSPQWRH